MTSHMKSNQNSGFTVVEMLAVVAIIIILLGVSAVAAVRCRDLLKITELDNAAREIYMAAENRAVLLSGARRLNSQVSKAGSATVLAGRAGGDAAGLYCVSKDGAEASGELLTFGSIDPALMDGDFYIVYDLDGGSVTDVFYAEESMAALVDGDFSAFYGKWAKSRSERLEMKREMLVGWYSGKAAEGGNIEPEIPEEPAVEVLITNQEELTVTVKYTAPGPARLEVTLGNIDLTSSAYAARKREETVQEGAEGVSYRCTWVLDSLTAGKFKDLGSAGVTPGGDFTVTAALTSIDGSFAAVSGSDTNNSLFQEGSGGETAYIKCLRHLQNLDVGNEHQSGAQGKTRAVQTDDVLGGGGEADLAYHFIPIFNEELKNYDGRNHEIRNLHVNYGDDAGLFSKVSHMELRNIRMVNATVTAAGKTVGALAGEAHSATVQNCWVYWQPDETVTDLKAVLGSDADRYRFEEAGIFGSTAGGLVGIAGEDCKIMNCLAATLVKGEACAGGLVGQIDNQVPIQNSYADCYLTGGRTADVAGLVGAVNGGVTLTNCYAAGYIMGGSSAAGLCLGAGTTTAANVYSAMRYPDRNIEDTFTFLTGNQTGDSFSNTHFLGKDSQQAGAISSTSYAEMTSEVFCAGMGGAFEWKRDDSHPYNLREHLFLNTYSYPGLAGLPHYGDWGAEFKEPSLVYCEQYGDKTWGVSGGNARDLVNSLEDKKSILSDGYAVAFLKGDLQADSVKITYTYLDEEGTQRQSGPHEYGKDQLTATKWANDDGSIADYYMIPLPDELVNSGYAQDCFYRYLKFDLNLGGEEGNRSGEYFFNPHFAETVVPVINREGAEGGWTPEKVEEHARSLAADMNGTREIKLRTPRHLYSLSCFKEYYVRRSVFHQILELDYSAYTGYGGFIQGTPFAQPPIGKAGEAFAGTYNGDYHSIKNVVPAVDEAAARRYAGLFGYSTGTLRNIVYEMDPEHQVTAYLGSTAENLYVGALAGGSAGTVENCAVSGVNLRAGASGVRLYVGGLVGRNQGVIRSCAAESARLSANCFNYASIYIGGLVGENASSRSISACYAVGRISAEVDATISNARICGFVGWNYGDISNSYAAVDLQSSGENVEIYGFCGVRAGSQSGTAYLDRGNFSYRDASYAANYRREEDKAGADIYAELTAREKADSLGMGTVWQGARPDPENEYPYPAAVRNENGDYVHYGRWPVPMPLGEMGVFYWEKLVDAESGGNPTYHLSALAVDLEKNTITKQSTLSQTHNDGGIVTDYGYGYYSSTEVAKNISLSVNNIGYTGYVTYNNRSTHLALKNMEPDRARDENSRSDRREIDAENAFAALIDGYEFHCWNTYREAPKRAENNADDYRAKRAVSGLCLFKGKASDELDPNSGSFTLSQTGMSNIKVEFIVNPQFADAISVKDSGGLRVTGGASAQAPGTAGNRYQVRCGMQLQDINWYDTAYTDVPVGLGSYEVKRFPYLSGENYTRNYYWEQTHDIDWVKERRSYDLPDAANDDGVFFPIAQVYAAGSSLPGWFGGSYDGGNYTIKNFSIGINTVNYNINAMGLFGAVKGATLENIVMYSETGDDVVTVLGRSAGGADSWYAGGVLAGIALDGRISNCAAAGYTIRDETRYARTSGDVGGAIGGLVGMTGMDLTGCTAATNIEISCTHSSQRNAPVRVGGLVGSTTAGVTNCYTGGQIVVTGEAKDAAIYAGRLTGGVGAGPFGGEDNGAGAAVSNCYSYLTLPGQTGVVRAVYAIGGLGRRNTNSGSVTLDNNYYLSSTAGSTNSEEQAITYQQLADREKIDGQSIYDKLNAGQTPAPYSPVTSEVGGLAMAGRFSYAPQNRLDLQGMDYPFPTVLTQTRVTDGMVFNVHYGGWAFSGIRREAGNQPVELDMFTGREYRETLKLSADIPGGGTWSVWAGGGDIVEALAVPVSGGAEAELTVIARKASGTPVSVTVEYAGTSGAVYSLQITVYVTAYVELRPGAVSIFPGDTVSVPLVPVGKKPGGESYEDLPPAGLRILHTEGVSPPLAAEAVMPSEAEPDAEPGVKLTRTGEQSAEAQMWMDVAYSYTKDSDTGQAEEQAHRIAVYLLDLPEGSWNEDGRSWSISFSGHRPAVEILDAVAEGFAVEVSDGSDVTLRKPEGSELPEGVRLEITLTMDGLIHKLTVPVPRPEVRP